ncbi:Arc family DNA-binding protein [Acetobacter sacchari]|uniref:Arc family DNA-binding protein n=1 Tax=Acetobacter sacchari TaxID=2661687 RepID=A0ABS3M0T8_9PROT|nr:Arc family DNA-binding protein [Acetobacter sacchari]MBO1361769.1 Arc family DNA-binding protein [Acetobacter sacchari]
MSDDDRYRRFNLRIPKDVFDVIQDLALERSHSMNAEIVQRLEASLMPVAMWPTDAPDDSSPISPEEKSFIAIMRSMSEPERMILRGVLRGMAEGRDAVSKPRDQ